jgi:hypothetical protein
VSASAMNPKISVILIFINVPRRTQRLNLVFT